LLSLLYSGSGDRHDRGSHADTDPADQASAQRVRLAHPRRRRGRGVGPILPGHADPLDHAPRPRALILIAFVVLAVLLALVAVRSMFKGWPLLERTFETSASSPSASPSSSRLRPRRAGQRARLDLLLGGFVAGLITRPGAPGP